MNAQWKSLWVERHVLHKEQLLLIYHIHFLGKEDVKNNNTQPFKN